MRWLDHGHTKASSHRLEMETVVVLALLLDNVMAMATPKPPLVDRKWKWLTWHRIRCTSSR
jgi:hypothetical protein